MTKVTFDEISGGTVSSTPDAFSVTNNGSGPALRGESKGGFTGIFGISQQNGIFGETASANGQDSGVVGKNDAVGNGVAGVSKSGFGVRGDTDAGFAAVHGHGGKNGMWGFTTSANDSGVFGQNDGDGFGVRGDSKNGFAAVHGHGGKNGVWGFSVSATASGVFGQNDGAGAGVTGFSASGIGVVGQGGKLAASFVGDVEIAGDLTIKNGKDIRLADFAEDFDVSGLEEIEPGSVVVLDDEGSVQQSRAEYDHKVAGVVSGAGNFRSAITLDRHKSPGTRKAIALMGKVYCKVDAQYSAIGVGDLLTTSATPGHAMKAVDPLKAFGSVIGKALKGLDRGRALIPILIALQ